MKVRRIAAHVARAAERFPLLGRLTEDDLLGALAAELGSAEALDDFQPYGSGSARAHGPRTLLHIMSGNTPHAGLQSLIRGLLLKAHNLCKIPSAGLPEIDLFRSALPAELADRVEISSDLPPSWFELADAIVVFGDDSTVEEFRRRVRPGQRFVGHGNRISFGIVFADPDYESVAGAAADASLFDQQGCLSPHLFFVRESSATSAQTYAKKLAEEMARFEARHPRRPLKVAESARIAALRAEWKFRAGFEVGAAQVWESAGSTAWTVIYDQNPQFTASCLNRVVFVKPLPAALQEALAPVQGNLSTAGIWPGGAAEAAGLADFGISRICPIGAMQQPPFSWHQDGGQNFTPLVHWTDRES